VVLSLATLVDKVVRAACSSEGEWGEEGEDEPNEWEKGAESSGEGVEGDLEGYYW
jgi:hypothetical protein